MPSHGTDFFGQRYAFDFVRLTGRRLAPFGPLQLAWAATVVPVDQFACWGAQVHAAESGRVVFAADDWPDRRWINAWWEIARLQVYQRWHPVIATRAEWRPLLGNHVLVEGPSGVALYAHLRRGSIRVSRDDRVVAGDPLGEIGNSGRSSMPHLHFHLMDTHDPFRARGIPCTFMAYERWVDQGWQPMRNGIPGRLERIRVTA